MYQSREDGSSLRITQKQRRKKKRAHYRNVRVVRLKRGKSGFGFTITGQRPCTLSYVATASPAAENGLKQGDYLLSINGINVSTASHDDVVCLIGSAIDYLELQIGEKASNFDATSSDEDAVANSNMRQVNPRVKRKQINPTNVRKHQRHPLADRNYSDDYSGRSSTDSLRYQQINLLEQHCFQDPPKIPPKPAIFKKPAPVIFPNADQQCGVSDAKVELTKFVHKEAAQLSPDSEREALIAKGIACKRKSNKAVVDLMMKRREQKSENFGIPMHISNPTYYTVSAPMHISNPTYVSVDSIVGARDLKKSRSDAALPHAKRKNREADYSTGMLLPAFRPRSASETVTTKEVMLHVVVGYVGSIEMPSETGIPGERLKAIKSCVRRLRMERKVNTLVLMEVTSSQVQLRNTDCFIIAVYPAEDLAFCGVCPDDKRFFGLVTMHLDNEEGGQFSSSCHVFVVDPELRPHDLHKETASLFRFRCTVDPATSTCLEFPRSASPILRAVAKLYKQPCNENSQRVSTDLKMPPGDNLSVESSDRGNSLGERMIKSAPNLREVQGGECGKPWYESSLPDDDLHPVKETIAKKSELLSSPKNNEVDFNIVGKTVRREQGSKNQSSLGSSSGVSSLTSHDSSTLTGLPSPMEVASPSSMSSVPFDVRPLAQSTSAQLDLPVVSPHYMNISGVAMDIVASGPGGFYENSAPPLQRGMSVGSDDVFDEQNSADNLRRSFRKLLDTRKRSDRNGSVLPLKLTQNDCSPPKLQAFNRSMSSPLPSSRRATVDGAYTSRIPREAEDSMEVEEEEKPHKGNDSIFKHPGKLVERVQSWSRGRSFQHGRKLGSVNRSHESLACQRYNLEVPQQQTSKRPTTSAANLTVSSESLQGDKNLRTRGRVAGWAVSFERLLEDDVGQLVFTDFLKKEFSEENIIFWKMVDDYKKITDIEERAKRAKEIYNRFVSHTASESVNVDAVARSKVENGLARPQADTFNAAEKQVYHMMKFDCYTRFIKDDLYKDCLLCEIESRPLPYEEDKSCSGTPRLRNKKKSKEEDERRKSLLPLFGHKKAKKAKGNADSAVLGESSNSLQVGMSSLPRNLSLASCDLVTLEKSVSASSRESLTSLGRLSSSGDLGMKFCRIILPNDITSVIQAKPGQTVKTVVTKMLEKKKLGFVQSFDVVYKDSGQVLDQNQDISLFASLELQVERRIVFSADLPNDRTVGARVHADRTIADVLPSLLHKYGLQVEDVKVYKEGSDFPLDPSGSAVSVEGCKLIIVKVDSPKISAKTAATNNKKNNAKQQSRPMSAISTGSNEEVEKSSICGAFSRWTPDRSRNKTKMSHDSRTGVHSSPVLRVRTYRKTDDSEAMLDMLAKAVSHRMEDQRGRLSAKDLEIPDFLRVPTATPGNRASDKYDVMKPIENMSQEGRRSCPEPRMSEAGMLDVPGGKLKCMDRSFSQDGVLPSHAQAEKYFGSQREQSVSVELNDSSVNQELPVLALTRDSKPSDSSSIDCSPKKLSCCRSSESPMDTTVLEMHSGDLDSTLTMGSRSHTPPPLTPPKNLNVSSLSATEAPNFSPPTPLITVTNDSPPLPARQSSLAKTQVSTGDENFTRQSSNSSYENVKIVSYENVKLRSYAVTGTHTPQTDVVRTPARAPLQEHSLSLHTDDGPVESTV